VRANQAVVRGWSYEDPRLHAVVCDVFQNAAENLVDWFYAIAHPEKFDELPVTVDDHIFQDGYRSQKEGKGVIYVGAHLGNVNMFFMKMAQQKFPVQVLSYHRDERNYHSDNQLRSRFGLYVTPVSSRSLREAYKRLNEGGFILTGVDRPDTGGEKYNFFGRETILPLGHSRMALRTGARIIIGVVQKTGPGRYHVKGSQLIDPQVTEDHERDVQRVTEQILLQLEEFIRERPSEWMMFVPLWPEVIPEKLG
jgi:KDO2-lipid IV(A) lauroyltransferase